MSNNIEENPTENIADSFKTMPGLEQAEASELEQVVRQAQAEGIQPGTLSIKPVSSDGPKTPEEEIRDLRVRISKMGLPEKIKLGMFGDANCRLLLICDPNKMIQACVLKNPQMQDREIEVFTKNPNLTQFVVRAIAENRKWMKSYEVKKNICFNPKTPTGISVRWVQHLNKTDIRRLAKSKGIPQALAVVAKKIAAQAMSGK